MVDFYFIVARLLSWILYDYIIAYFYNLLYYVDYFEYYYTSSLLHYYAVTIMSLEPEILGRGQPASTRDLSAKTML